MAHLDIVTLGLLLLIACVVAIVTRKIGLPYSVGLVAAEILLSLSGYRAGIALTPELIFTVLLPPLVFEAALHLRWDQFKREAPLVLSLAFVGTLLSALVVAAGMHWLARWSWQGALLFGALIAATDPVSVISMMKEQAADKRLRFLMESESLVNDGAAAVLFALVAAWIAGGATDAGSISLSWSRQLEGECYAASSSRLASCRLPADRMIISSRRRLRCWRPMARSSSPRNSKFRAFWRP